MLFSTKEIIKHLVFDISIGIIFGLLIWGALLFYISTIGIKL